GTHTLAAAAGACVPVFMVHYKDVWALARRGSDAARLIRKNLAVVKTLAVEAAERIEGKQTGPNGPYMAIDGIAARIDEYTRKKDEVFHLRCDALEGEVAAMYVDLVRLVNKGR